MRGATGGQTGQNINDITSDAAKDCQVTIKLKAVDAPTEAQLTSGNQVRQVMISQNTWKKIKLDAIRLGRGTNHLKFLVTSGVADLDWVDLSLAEKSQPAAR